MSGKCLDLDFLISIFFIKINHHFFKIPITESKYEPFATKLQQKNEKIAMISN